MKLAQFAALAALSAMVISTAASAGEGVTSYRFNGSFDDAAFGVENAIINRGLVTDYVSHVGEMLNRTGEDVGSDVTIFKEADVYLFCSAVISREVMEADPMNIAHCPYGIFVAEREGKVMVGYREYPAGPMDKVEALLDEIAREAVGKR